MEEYQRDKVGTKMNIVDAKMETGALRSGRGNKSEGKVRKSFLTAQKYHISPWIYRREII